MAGDAQNTFGSLSPEQLNWKPGADQWSIAQCLDHLIVVNSPYFPLIEKIAKGEYRTTLKERMPLLPYLFGSMILRSVQPETQRRSKAFRKFHPSGSAIDAGIVVRFKAHQQELVHCMQKTEDLKLEDIIITSPVSSFITYSLFDAYRIVVAHEQRHLAQARRVMQTEGFPKSRPGAPVAS